MLMVGIANVFIQSSALVVTLSLKLVQGGLETNYVIATLGVYLRLYNVFQNLLAVLGIFGGRDE